MMYKADVPSMEHSTDVAAIWSTPAAGHALPPWPSPCRPSLSWRASSSAKEQRRPLQKADMPLLAVPPAAAEPPAAAAAEADANATALASASCIPPEPATSIEDPFPSSGSLVVRSQSAKRPTPLECSLELTVTMLRTATAVRRCSREQFSGEGSTGGFSSSAKVPAAAGVSAAPASADCCGSSWRLPPLLEAPP
jgi:hypothetical protein